jgi:hypothetical protein
VTDVQAVLKYRNLPVKRKLDPFIMVTVCTALMLACSAVLIYVDVVLQRTMANHLDILTEIFAFNNTAALTFDHSRVARELLAALKASRSIELAEIYAADGKIFGSDNRENRQRESVGDAPGFAYDGGIINLTLTDGSVHPINVDAARKGQLNINSKLPSLARIARRPGGGL